MDRPPADQEREAALVAALGAIRARIAAACEAVGRDPREVTLIAVTKTCPVSDLAALARLGVRDVGESKDQEARAKIAELGEFDAPEAESGIDTAEFRWHLVGRLQTNKARSVAGYASAVHSVDRPKLATALADAADSREHPLDVFAQVSLDSDPQRGGVAVEALPELADAIAARPELRLRGVMTVPPMDTDADAAFARLAELSAQLNAAHPGAEAISAGMSADFETAIAHGATHVRIGTALLGRRAQVFS